MTVLLTVNSHGTFEKDLPEVLNHFNPLAFSTLHLMIKMI